MQDKVNAIDSDSINKVKILAGFLLYNKIIIIFV